MIYVDGTCQYASGNWCHMWTDGTDDELDVFAKRIGLKKQWAQVSHGVSGRFYHYDLRPSKRRLALAHGACYMLLTQWIGSKMA